jgi:cytosine/uracil/thiamine/allantoin permease
MVHWNGCKAGLALGILFGFWNKKKHCNNNTTEFENLKKKIFAQNLYFWMGQLLFFLADEDEEHQLD